jgi:putative alpha-1,2-mannosidase
MATALASAPGMPARAVLISKSVQLNNQPYSKTYIDHETLMKGGVLGIYDG